MFVPIGYNRHGWETTRLPEDTDLRRYQGEDLRAAPRIAVVANDAIGNFVVSTPLLQMLKERFKPFALDYYGGARTWELIENSDLIDYGYPLHGAPPNETAKAIAERTDDGSYDLIVNLEWTAYAKTCTAMLSHHETFICGPSFGRGGRADLEMPGDDRGDLWRDQEWISEELTKKYPFLNSGFIGEIFCRLAYLEGDVPRYRLPSKTPAQSIPDVLIATAASLPDKLWAPESWIQTLNWLKGKGISVGLIGAPPARQQEFWKGNSVEDDLVAQGLVEDLRGVFSLPEVVGALGKAKAVFSVDNGVMHLAAGTETPIVGLFRYGIHRLWAPPAHELTVLTPAPDDVVATITATDAIAALGNALKIG